MHSIYNLMVYSVGRAGAPGSNRPFEEGAVTGVKAGIFASIVQESTRLVYERIVLVLEIVRSKVPWQRLV